MIGTTILSCCYYRIAHRYTVEVLGTVNPRRRNLSACPTNEFPDYANPDFVKTKDTLKEARDAKLNIDNIRTSIFEKTGEMRSPHDP